ncbi:MAG: radical SAM protein [Spirochaetales bacterium]|nr:radical SAM protein [Spirochaetales bacterium]
MISSQINTIKRMIKKGLRDRLYPAFWNLDRVPVKPTYVSIGVAETCFFRCKHCDIWKLKPAKNRMSLKQYNLALKKVYNWLGDISITFSGGEPFINPDLSQIVNEANRLGLKTYVNTNGFIVNQASLDKVVKAGIDAIHISIDSLGKEHDWSRGKKGAFKKAEAVIKMIKKTKNKLKSNLEIGMTKILMKTKLERIDDLIDWGEKIGIEAIYFQALNENFGVAKHDPNWYQKSILWPEKDKAVTTINRLIELKKAGRIIGSSFSQLRDYLDYYQSGPKKYGLKYRCYVGLKNFSIAMNGDVRLCSAFKPIGNVLLESLEKIWNGSKAKRQREKIRKCKRGCRVLLCNRRANLSFKEVLKIVNEKLKR